MFQTAVRLVSGLMMFFKKKAHFKHRRKNVEIILAMLQNVANAYFSVRIWYAAS